MRFGLLKCFSFIVLALCLPSIPVSSAPPNIVLIMTDDQGYGDFGVTGNPVLRTPNLGALAVEGATVSQFYVSPVCSPTRASLMTGRYNYRTRVVDTFQGRSMMDPDEVTLAEVLREGGYTTGIFGKWHLGDNYPMRPNDQGFEETLVHRGGGLGQPSEPVENDNRYTDPVLFHNGEKVQMEGYCTDIYFDAAMEFAERSREANRPFFIYLAANAPHSPYHDVPEELYHHYRSADLSAVAGDGNPDVVARVYAMIENIDCNVGRLRDHLKSQGLSGNTIVVFLNDNGPNTRRFVGPFRGMKTEVHEGGIRSPFFFLWPDRIASSRVVHQVAAHIDVFPTLLEAAGVKPPANVTLDGRSLLPLLEGRAVDWPERNIFIQSHRGDQPIPFHHVAVRGPRWKLVHPTGFRRYQMPENVPFELYDVVLDPGENHNLAGRYPQVVEEMKAAYRKWFEAVSMTRPDNFAVPRIVVGTDAEPISVLTPQDWRVSDTAGWGKDARWLLKFQGAHEYEVELLWKQPQAFSKLVLQVAGTSHEFQTEEVSDRYSIDSASIPSGDASLRVEAVSTTGESMEPHHVILRRLDRSNSPKQR